MKRLILIAACLLGGTAQAKTIEDCVKTKYDLVRLACYDRLFREPINQEEFGGWSINEDMDDLTGKPIVIASTAAANTMSCNPRFTAKLHLRCNGGEFSMFIHHGCYTPGKQDRVSIEYRLGEGSVLQRQTTTDNSNKAFGHWDTMSARRWLRALIGAERLTVRFTPYKESRETLVFDIRETDTARDRLKEICPDIE